MDPPWPTFFADTRNLILNTVVSHRPSLKVSGALHEETNYGPPSKDEKGKAWVHVRKPLANLTANEVEEIADPMIKKLVQQKLAELGHKDPKKDKSFTNEQNLPYLTVKKDGRKIPIRKARLKKSLTTFPVGEGPRQRFVTTGENHHLEIYEVKDKKGNPKWEGLVVDLLTAKRRMEKGEPVVKRDHGEGKIFVFSLANGEVIEIDDGNREKGLYIIRTFTQIKTNQARVWFVQNNDARQQKEIKAAKDWRSSFVEGLREKNCRKVIVTPLGEVRPAHD